MITRTTSDRSSLQHHNLASLVLLLTSVALLTLGSVGCNKSKPTADAKPSKPSDSETKIAEVTGVETGTTETVAAKTNDATANNSADSAAGDSAADAHIENPSGDVTKTDAPPDSVAAATAVEPESWSTQRIVAIVPTGPVVIDIQVNIDGHSLEDATARATRLVTERIERDLKQPWTWEQLLDHPLIVSGWLGNLLAPTEQRAQVIAMYNTNSDESVDENELAAFLSRGLARSSPLRFTDLGNAPNAVASNSPWQPLDLDQDSQLDATEISQIAKTLARFDFNADRVLTVAELERDRAQPGAEMTGGNSGMLENKIAFAIHSTHKPKQAASGVLQRYTVLESISRETWPGWSDAQWKEFDANNDGQLVRSELERIVTVPPNLEIKVRFHDAAASSPPSSTMAATTAMSAKPQAASTLLSSVTAAIAPKQNFDWVSREPGTGQLSGESFTLTANITDSFTAANRAALRSQLASAITNPQIAAVFRTQLQLSDNAFEILDADGDSQLSDEEFDAVWLWFTTIRGSRVLARWFLADSVWFQLADSDGDSRLTEAELQKLPGRLKELDANTDGLVSPSEIPVAARLEVVRADNRLNNGPLPAMPKTPAATGTGWFAATDSNSDGFIATQEFLGTADEFSSYDSNKDGFISSEEAYKTQTPEVQ